MLLSASASRRGAQTKSTYKHRCIELHVSDITYHSALTLDSQLAGDSFSVVVGLLLSP